MKPVGSFIDNRHAKIDIYPKRGESASNAIKRVKAKHALHDVDVLGLTSSIIGSFVAPVAQAIGPAASTFMTEKQTTDERHRAIKTRKKAIAREDEARKLFIWDTWRELGYEDPLAQQVARQIYPPGLLGGDHLAPMPLPAITPKQAAAAIKKAIDEGGA
jgi:hypothetical protein